MKTDGYIIVKNVKYLLSAKFQSGRTAFTRRDSGKDGVRFTSEEEIIAKSPTALNKLGQGKEIVI